VLPTRSCHRLMIKRRNWAVTRGGGEYGSEDSSDSDLEEEERQVRAPIVSFPCASPSPATAPSGPAVCGEMAARLQQWGGWHVGAGVGARCARHVRRLRE
jgi:hypothetical protein